MTIPVILVHELFSLGKNNNKGHNSSTVCCMFTKLLRLSLFYLTPFKSYGIDFSPTTDIENRFWKRGQFANQAAIVYLHLILHTYDRLMSVNMLMQFHEKITEIVRVVAPEIKFCYGQITHNPRKLETSFFFLT